MQHDLDIANAAGSAVRPDINNALLALSDRQSGASAPSTTRAYQQWLDTANGVIKRRNAANSAWLVDASVAESKYVTRSSNTVLALTDYGRTIVATAAFTQTLTAAATLGDGWCVEYFNDSSGTVVIDPNASETINGATTLSLTPRQRVKITCTGTAFRAVTVSALKLVADYTSASDAASAAATHDAFMVPGNQSVTAVSSAGKNILWDYAEGANSKNVGTVNGTVLGLFSDYDCMATRKLVGQFRETQTGVTGGGFRDLVFLNAIDNDTSNYTAIGNKVTHAFRAFTQGAHDGTNYLAQTKDLVGGYFAASGAISWSARGVSALLCDTYQYHEGIASHEFHIHNPSAATGGLAQSKSGAAGQFVVRYRFANEDGTHFARGVIVENNGLRITAGMQFMSNTSEGFTSEFKWAIDMSTATVTAAGIKMPLSAAGSIIEYGANKYSSYDDGNLRFNWTIAGLTTFSVTQRGILFGVAGSAGTVNGEMWWDGTNWRGRKGGATVTFTTA